MQGGTLPVARTALATVAEMMVVERGDDFVLRAKSGWARPPEGDIGWWVGWVERGERTVLFATCLLSTGRDAALGPAREAVTRAALAAIDALPDPNAEEASRFLAALFPNTHRHSAARSLPLIPWTRHRVFRYSHFTWPHIPSACGAFDLAGVPRLFSANPGFSGIDPIEQWNLLAREEELTLADDAAADRYARFVLDCWFAGFDPGGWFATVDEAVAALAARGRGEAGRRAPGPLGPVACDEGWKLEGARLDDLDRGYQGVELTLRRDGTIALAATALQPPR